MTYHLTVSDDASPLNNAMINFIAPRILVTSWCPCTGASSVAANVLTANIGGSLIEINTLGRRGQCNAMRMSLVDGDCMFMLREELVKSTKPVTVDLGAFELRHFLNHMESDNISLWFDYCVIVSDRTYDAQQGTIRIFDILKKLGFPQERIRILLNKADSLRRVESQYRVLFERKISDPGLPLNPMCALPMHDLFFALERSNMSHQQSLADKTIYSPLIRAATIAGDYAKQYRLTHKAIAQRLASSGIEKHLARAFHELGIPASM
jgi:hypothetical protein